MRFLKLIAMFFIVVTFLSCATSKAVISNSVELLEYKYVVFGEKSTGDRELDDIVLQVQNEISNNLKVVSSQEGLKLIQEGFSVLTPNIHVTTEKWEGGHTYISINFYDYNTNQSVVVVKSSGIGLTIQHDQKIALKAISKKLSEVF